MRLAATIPAILILFLFSGAPIDSAAPDAQELHKRYGVPNIEFFDVSSGIAIAVEYGPDRMACELLIGRKQSLIRWQSADTPISSKVVSALLQELVPVAERGKQLSSTSADIVDKVQLNIDYENVSIRRQCFTPSCVSSDQNQDLRTLIVFRRGVCPTHFN